MSSLRRLWGLHPKNKERSLWVDCRSLEGFRKVQPFLARLRRRHQRLGLVFTASDDALAQEIRGAFPISPVHEAPLDHPLARRIFLKRLNVRLCLVLKETLPLGTSWAEAIEHLAIPVVALGTEGLSHSLIPARCELRIDEAQLIDKEESERLCEAIWPILARDLKRARDEGGGFSRGWQTWLRGQVDRGCFAWRLERYDSLDALRQELRKGKAVGLESLMCLGNGPSSEDERLADYSCDALFRVNHSWLARGRFASPDIVFCGGKSTMRALDGVIFGVQTREAEGRLLATRFPGLGRGKTRYLVVNRIGDWLAAFDWGDLRPTNGASMLALAVALQPKRLVVAGVDLFQHPAGSYPGDAKTPNAYSPGHSLEKELQFLLGLFDLYQGELVILSDVLRQEWETHKARISSPAARL